MSAKPFKPAVNNLKLHNIEREETQQRLRRRAEMLRHLDQDDVPPTKIPKPVNIF